VRPGDAFTMLFTFVNRGGAPAADRYPVFVHFERPRKDCRDIVFQADFEPTFPTLGWEPGQPIESSRKARIYHAFGDSRLRVGGREYQVARESIIRPGLEPRQ
jgi:hypothetical protein